MKCADFLHGDTSSAALDKFCAVTRVRPIKFSGARNHVHVNPSKHFKVELGYYLK